MLMVSKAAPAFAGGYESSAAALATPSTATLRAPQTEECQNTNSAPRFFPASIRKNDRARNMARLNHQRGELVEPPYDFGELRHNGP